MLAEINATLLVDYAEWVRRSIITERRFVAVYGCVDSGKSALFSSIANEECYEGASFLYWDLAPIDRTLSSAEKFWSTFSSVMAVDDPGPLTQEEDVEDFIELAIAESPHQELPIILVLDHWDLALDDPLDRIDQGAQDQLRSYLLNRHENRKPGDRELKLVTLVESPNPDAFVSWAREREAASPGLQAMSKTLERRFAASRMPLLSPLAATKILMTNTFQRTEAEHLAKYTGGWLSLMGAALEAKEGAQQIEEFVARQAWHLMSKASWPALKRSFPIQHEESDDEWILRVVSSLQDSGDPHDKFHFYGIPDRRVSGGGFEPIEAIKRSLPAPRYMLVDLENFLYGERDPELRTRTLEIMTADLNINPDLVLISARSRDRARQLLAASKKPWQVVTTGLPAALKIKKDEFGSKDNSDDVVLAAWFAHLSGKNRYAHFFIVSSDNDFWGALEPFVTASSSVTQIVKDRTVRLAGRNSYWKIDYETQPSAVSRAEKKYA